MKCLFYFRKPKYDMYAISRSLDTLGVLAPRVWSGNLSPGVRDRNMTRKMMSSAHGMRTRKYTIDRCACTRVGAAIGGVALVVWYQRLGELGWNEKKRRDWCPLRNLVVPGFATGSLGVFGSHLRALRADNTSLCLVHFSLSLLYHAQHRRRAKRRTRSLSDRCEGLRCWRSCEYFIFYLAASGVTTPHPPILARLYIHNPLHSLDV